MSKLMLFDFECAEHGLFEDLVNPAVRQVPCPQCGLHSQRQLSAPRIDHMAMAMSPTASPESIRKWERAHRQQKAKEQRTYDRHGDYGTAPGSSGSSSYVPQVD
jgi:hypothetical protein